jgi:hypothetical protein
MHFDKLSQIIREEKNYNIIASYIVENDIDLGGFLIETFEKISSTIKESEKTEVNNFLRMLNEIGVPHDVAAELRAKDQAEKDQAEINQANKNRRWPDFAPKSSPQEEKPGFFKSLRQKFSKLWNISRGNPHDIPSVVDILKKAQEYLNSPELKDKYSEEISQIAKAIESINSKQSTST